MTDNPFPTEPLPLDGRWTSAVVFSLAVPILSKSNHRHSRRGSWGAYRSFEDAVAYQARAALPTTWPLLGADKPLAQRPTCVLAIIASTRIDATNLPKSVADALEGVAYVNDASVRASCCVAHRSSRNSAVVALAALHPNVSMKELATASAVLTSQAVDYFSTAFPEE